MTKGPSKGLQGDYPSTTLFSDILSHPDTLTYQALLYNLFAHAELKENLFLTLIILHKT